MSMYVLETGNSANDTNITQRITLGDNAYSFNYRYNLRDESWIITLSLVGKDPLFTVKACSHRVFNSHFKHLEGAPQGDLTIVDVTDKYGRINLEDFSSTSRYRLVYVEPEE